MAPQIHPFDFSDEIINADDYLSRTCTISKGDLPISIYWTLNEKHLNLIEGVTVMNTNKRTSQITIESVQAHHSGKYTCNAENKAGKTSYSTYLNVNGIYLIVLTPFFFFSFVFSSFLYFDSYPSNTSF